MARTHPYLHIAIYALVMSTIVWGIYQGAVSTGYRWQWHRIPPYLFEWQDGELVRGYLIDGLLVTLRISAQAFVLMVVIGLVTALLSASNSLVGRWLARGYVEIIRNTPLLVQLYLIYFALSPVLGLDRMTAAILTLALFEGAYASEIIRGAVAAVPQGQSEAARALGLGAFATTRLVVLPQALRLMLPPLTGQTVSLIKDSSIVSVIAVFDLTTEARNIASDTFLVFEVWFTVAALYLALTVTLSFAVTAFEHRLKRSPV
ncbi:MAG: amino acid ABC transporter permease [Pseudomonadota bacterium]